MILGEGVGVLSVIRMGSNVGKHDHFEDRMLLGGTDAIVQTGHFFMRDDPVHETLRRISGKLETLGIPYAIAGGMALVAHGYDRTTVDIDIVLTADGWTSAQDALAGLGYLPPFPGSRHLRDTRSGVRIEFLIAGEYPGDGRPKPVAFPDPASSSVQKDGIRYVDLPHLVELKLASGMTNPGRLKDLADVQELIRCLRLPDDFSRQLHDFVRAKYLELWQTVQDHPADIDPPRRD